MEDNDVAAPDPVALTDQQVRTMKKYAAEAQVSPDASEREATLASDVLRLTDEVTRLQNARDALTGVDSKRPQQAIYRSLRNLILNEWGLSKTSLIQQVVETFKLDGTAAARDWLNGQHMRDFVSKVTREVVRAMAEPILKAEAKAFLDRRIKLEASITATVTPEEKTS